MNFVFIMTDTQNKSMIGAYGNSAVDTPNLDRLAAEGILFENAYTACPVCTPARGSMLTGLYPQINGAWCNNTAPNRQAPMMGEIFSYYNWRVGYTGKWHLSGTGYFDNGQPQGGFEPDWWYDGKCYAEDIGDELFSKYKKCKTADDLRDAGFTRENLWGNRVADRAVDFLENVGEENFVLVASFDEPHGPFVAPTEYWESFQMDNISRRENFGVVSEDVPRLQATQMKDLNPEDWESYKANGLQKHYACNAYIDREIGRVIDAAEQFHGDDTVIIYTTDHGSMQGSHCLEHKGPEMYEEIANVPFIVKTPNGPAGVVSESLVSHLDILPTMLDMNGLDVPETLQGVSLGPVLKDPSASIRQMVMINWHRFAVNRDAWGEGRREFYPIRCVFDGRYKLAINLLDTDELYDLHNDPWELENRIYDDQYASERDRLHDMLLEHIYEIRDPFRCRQWGCRSWRELSEPPFTLKNRKKAEGFPFEPSYL